MNALHKISAIASVEMKTLYRSGFFRIFSLLTLLFIVLFDTVLFSLPYSPWMFRGIPSSIPYMNLLILNLAQVFIAVFLATEFLKQDRRLDTTDVVYIKSMSNSTYVIGKFFGIAGVFVALNLLVLLTALVFNVFFIDVPVVPEAYFWYPLLISVPALVFVFGLTFFVMSLVGNQAVTFSILVGYSAITVAFLGHRFHTLFDFTAMNLPLLYSDFVGFGTFETILMQRLFFVLLGVAFVGAAALLLKRLPQSRSAVVLVVLATLVSGIGGIISAQRYYNHFTGGIEKREQIRALNREMVHRPVVTVGHTALDVEHAGNELRIDAALVFDNPTDEPIDGYLFNLNPGMRIEEVLRNGTPVPWERNLHMVTVTPGTPLAPGAADSLTVRYHGTIDGQACYADINEETRADQYRHTMFIIQKRYGFVTPDYVLVTPETMWYPSPGIPRGGAYPETVVKGFGTFDLTVRTDTSLTAVSQGAVSSPGDGEWHFVPATTLPHISLAIGRYQKKAMNISGIDYELYYLDGHDFFSEYFPNVEEYLPDIVSDAMITYEDRLGIMYPYERFMLIETPIQLAAYSRMWTLSQETVQPEMTLLPEKGVNLDGANFKMMHRLMSSGGRGPGRGRGGDMTEDMVSEMLMQRFISSTFEQDSGRFGVRIGGLPLVARGLSAFLESASMANYSPFPQFYTFRHEFYSEEPSMFNMAMELYLSQRVETGGSFFEQLVSGITEKERANLVLAQRSLERLLADPPEDIDIMEIMRNKSTALFSLIEETAGEDEFNFFLDDYLYVNSLETIPVASFVDTLQKRYRFNLADAMDNWMHETDLPAFDVYDISAEEIIDQSMTVYQTSFVISNRGDGNGVATVQFRLGGNDRGGPGVFVRVPGGGGGMLGISESDSDDTILVKVDAGQSKEVGVVLDLPPRQMTVDTHVSLNLPAVFDVTFNDIPRNEDAMPFEGERVLPEDYSNKVPGEIVIDNEDVGFSIYNKPIDSPLRRFIYSHFQQEEEYGGLEFWNVPLNWEPIVNSSFYGSIRKSAYYIRPGEGENLVTWEADIDEPGRYAVYFYVPDLNLPFGGGRGRGRRGSMIEDLNLTIYHGDGEDTVTIHTDQVSSGWYLLGNYYFSEGTARVQLNDKSGGRIVLADAVKWTLH